MASLPNRWWRPNLHWLSSDVFGGDRNDSQSRDARSHSKTMVLVSCPVWDTHSRYVQLSDCKNPMHGNTKCTGSKRQSQSVGGLWLVHAKFPQNGTRDSLEPLYYDSRPWFLHRRRQTDGHHRAGQKQPTRWVDDSETPDNTDAPDKDRANDSPRWTTESWGDGGGEKTCRQYGHVKQRENQASMHFKWYECPQDNEIDDHIGCQHTGHFSHDWQSGLHTSTLRRCVIFCIVIC